MTSIGPSKNFTLSVHVPFRDVDMHGHVHNAVHLCYVETAINAFLKNFNLSQYFSPASNDYHYHVKKTELIFDRPSRFEDELKVTICLKHIGTTSLTFAGYITGKHDDTPRVKSTVIWVCVDAKTCRPCKIPSDTRAALGVFLTPTFSDT